MKRTLFQLAVLLPIVSGCMVRAAEIGDFKLFTSKEGRFTAEFPGVPTASEKEMDTPIGKMTMHLFLLRIGNEYEYSTAYADLPGPLTARQLKQINVEGGLDGARNGIMRGTKSRMVKESKITLDKWPGREWELEGTGDGNEDFVWRCYFAKARQYQICVGWLKGHRPSKEILYKFLDSLKISAE